MSDKKTHVDLVAAARPNFMKIAPLYHALQRVDWCAPRIVHTGQHYDPNMSDVFLADLALPRPHHNLGVGSDTHAMQTADVMRAYDRMCEESPPDWTVVVGDVNSTIACALTAAKRQIPVCHLEAGLRSRDRTMPEEINRVLTDAISDVLWTPSLDANDNLRQEGILAERIDFVGNIMIDSYELLRAKIDRALVYERLNLAPASYGVVTLHRPANVDSEYVLSRIVRVLLELAEQLPLVFPIHPRTRRRLDELGLSNDAESSDNLHVLEPMGYIDFMSLVSAAQLVLTDSGGIQEETTYLGIPCLTMRDTTERPITVSQGTNQLVNIDTVSDRVSDILAGNRSGGTRPRFWDGRTAQRVVTSLASRAGVT